MQRNGAAPFYFFSREYLRSLKTALGSHGSLMVTTYEGQMIAAALIIEYRRIVHTYLVASDDEFKHIPAVKLLMDCTRLWARKRGNDYLHLGGGRGGHQDSLLRFKSLFSKTYLPFYVGRWILNQDAYECLSRDRERQARSLGHGLTADFFPSYRAAFVRAEEGDDLALYAADANIEKME
jgi:hypothetical protein